MSEPRSHSGVILRDCLVAVVNHDADLRRFRDEAWYRIPERALGRSVGRDALQQSSVLALYQTGDITDGLPSSIELWGEISEVETLPRRKLLPDEPHHPAADQLYHQVRLSYIHQLDEPILSRTPRRLAFLRTTRQHLLAASDINDLIIGSPAEEKLWKEICKQSTDFHRQIFMEVNGTVMEVDIGLILGNQGLAILCRDDEEIRENMLTQEAEAWRVIRFSPAAIQSDLENCVRQILRAAEEIRRVMKGGEADR